MVVTATRGEHGTDDPVYRPPGRLAPLREREHTSQTESLARALGAARCRAFAATVAVRRA